MTNYVAKAISIANRAHRYQTRKFSGLPYIVHPMEVMNTLVVAGVVNEKTLAAAILHDVIEDCHECFENDIREMSSDVHLMVRALTKGETEEETNNRLINGGDSVQLIKTADIASNTRIDPVEYKTLGQKYLEKKLAQLRLFNVSVCAHPLWRETVASIESQLQSIYNAQ